MAMLIEENLRFFIEECDQLQGFQLMTDITGGFGGLSAGLMETLRDEFPKTSMITFALEDRIRGSPKPVG
jgi:hypothetical protein